MSQQSPFACDESSTAPDFEQVMRDKERLAAGLLRTLLVLHEPGTVVEIRAKDVKGRGGGPHLVSGYYDDLEQAVRDAVDLDWQYQPSGIYCTLNCINPDLLARSPNQLTDGPKVTTGGADVTRRQWLMIDLDPVRPSGISSTDEEMQGANRVAEEVREWLMARYPLYEPVHALSGNGVHLLFPIDLPNDEDGLRVVQQILNSVSKEFAGRETSIGCPAISIDTSVDSAAQLTKLYGTIARKGHDIEERPHRRSRLTYVPDYLELPQDSEGWYAP